MLNRIMTAATETVRVHRTFAVPRHALFRAWTDPHEFGEWWQPGPYSTTAVAMDVRVGGTYRITMRHADGSRQYLFGTYLEVQPPGRLAMTWCLEGSERDDGYKALLTLEFREAPDGTELVLVHDSLPSTSIEMYAAGWSGVLGCLDKHLS